MRALTYYRYGTPDVLQLQELETPTPSDDELLIAVHAVSINGSDRENLVGRPLYVRMSGLRRPNNPILGSDIAGTVVSVGKNHTEFEVGDEIFGEIPGYHGGLAEYVSTDGRTMMRKPTELTFEEAAAIPQAGTIALRAIQETGHVQPGQSVLINGAGGSGGSFAVQLAKLRGAQVTGVDSPGKLDFIRSLGADNTIDYSMEDFTSLGEQYDLILDLIAHRSPFAYKRALKPGGRCYVVGGSVAALLQALVLGSLVGRTDGKKIGVLMVPQNRNDLSAITKLCVSGQVTPIIDRQYSLDEAPEALRYVSEGHARGKVVISLRPQHEAVHEDDDSIRSR